MSYPYGTGQSNQLGNPSIINGLNQPQQERIQSFQQNIAPPPSNSKRLPQLALSHAFNVVSKSHEIAQLIMKRVLSTIRTRLVGFTLPMQCSQIKQIKKYETKLNCSQNQVKELLQDKMDIVGRINKLEKRQLENAQSLEDDKKKRHRRSAHEIERHYRCPCEPCQKSYGSEGSLAQHIKIKHPIFFATISNNISQCLQNTRREGPPTNFDDDSDLQSDEEQDEEESGGVKKEDQKEQNNPSGIKNSGNQTKKSFANPSKKSKQN